MGREGGNSDLSEQSGPQGPQENPERCLGAVEELIGDERFVSRESRLHGLWRDTSREMLSEC